MESYKILGERKPSQYIGQTKDEKQILITKLSPNFKLIDFWNNRLAYGIPCIFSIFNSDGSTYIESELVKGVP
jgi:hypothetical protein